MQLPTPDVDASVVSAISLVARNLKIFSAGGFAPCMSDDTKVGVSDSQSTLHSLMTYLFAAWSSPAISGTSSSLAMVGAEEHLLEMC